MAVLTLAERTLREGIYKPWAASRASNHTPQRGWGGAGSALIRLHKLLNHQIR